MSDRQIDETHAPTLTSWVDSAAGHPDFPIQNLPFGIFSSTDGARRGGIAIGDQILDLAALAKTDLLQGSAITAAQAAAGPQLNDLLALGEEPRRALRRQVSRLLSDVRHRDAVSAMLHPADACEMHLPASIGDYTDFYAGIHHALNVGRLFRPDAPLLPNYKHVPIGYHGRASTVRPSGVPVRRPSGQIKSAEADGPHFAPTARLDFELELGAWIATGNPSGAPIPLETADQQIAGLCLLNDWSARDIQAWEYQPLGPFLSKSFHTTISPWIITSEALAPFRTSGPARMEADPPLLAYLSDPANDARGGYDLALGVNLSTRRMREAGLAPFEISRSHASHMYWTVGQMVAHHTSNGCILNPGDLLGTGTISGPSPDSVGSLLERAKGGVEPFVLPNGESRSFLEDGDEVTLSGRLGADGFVSIGFGECRGRIDAG